MLLPTLGGYSATDGLLDFVQLAFLERTDKAWH